MQDGRLYGMPSSSDHMLIYDIASDEVTGSKIPTSIDAGAFQWSGGVAYDGFFYGVPFDSGYILAYNMATSDVSAVTVPPEYV